MCLFTETLWSHLLFYTTLTSTGQFAELQVNERDIQNKIWSLTPNKETIKQIYLFNSAFTFVI